MMDRVPNQSITAWPWPDELDAVSAAPDSHRILLENAHVRVLEIVIPPGHREPMHTHRWPSVMLIDVSAAIRYYQADGQSSDYPRRAAALFFAREDGNTMTRGATSGSELHYSDGIAAARTMIAPEGNAAALQRRLPSPWELAPYAGDDLRGTSLRGANMLVLFHEV
jgi:hypothetical protein